MTEDNRRRNIDAEVKRAEESLRSAQTLLDAGLFSDAISRAYYGVFHILRALVLSRGVEPKTHEGAIHLFNVELVRPGLFPGTYNRLIAGLQRARELADYDAAVAFSSDDAKAQIADARELTREALEFLGREGWIQHSSG